MASFAINSNISIELRKLTSSRHKRFGYGELLLSIENTPIWYSGQVSAPVPLKWNWLGLLSFLASNWPWLFAEQDIPFVVTPESIPEYWYRDYQTIKSSIFDKNSFTPQKESSLRSFVSRHDLSESSPGIELSSVFILRTGKCFIISAENKQIIVDLHEAYNFFEKVGNEIVSWVRDVDDKNIKSILWAWENKDETAGAILKEKAYLIAGMSQDDLDYLSDSNKDYWEFEWHDHMFFESEVFAAARLSHGYICLEQQRKILKLIKNSKRIVSPSLDAATTAISWRHWGVAPYKQGYIIAAKLREHLKVPHDRPIDPHELLQSWGIPVYEHVFEGAALEAIACWGGEHGPVIFLNTAEGNKCSHTRGKLFTLAHEICHLLVDRNSTLDVCEVLGGATPKLFEKRANAFAAELLFPQRLAFHLIQRSEEHISTLINYLVDAYSVTVDNVAWQILNNASARVILRKDEIDYLKNLTSADIEYD